MKRYLRLAAWCLGLALAVTACGRAGRIVLPEAAEVTAIRVTAGDAVTLHTDRDWIGEFLQQAAEAVSTGMESVQDAPDQTGAVKVELGTGETPDWSVLYVYEADGICCLEQPYTGIYQGDEALWTVLAADAAPEGESTVNRPSTGWIVCLLLCGMLIAGVFYLIGYKAAYDRMENTVPSTVEVSIAWQGVSPCGS